MSNTKVSSEQIIDDVALGGSPTTTTQSASDNSTKVATTAYVTTAVANLVDSAPSSLNTLNELSAALNDNASFFNTVLPLSGGTLTGTVTSQDGAEIRLGTDNDMGLFHSSGVSHIRVNSGTFKLRADDMRFTAQDGTTEAMRIASSKIGIGTGANIDELLHLEKTSGTTIVKTEVAANSVVGFEIQKTNATTSNWRIVDGQTVNGNLEVYDVTDSRLVTTFDGSGNVGIGPINPSSYDSGARKLVVGDPSVSSQGITISADTNSIIYFADGTSGAEAYMGSVIYNHANNNMTFRTNGFNTALTLDSSQNATFAGIAKATDFEFTSTAGKIHFGGSGDTGDYVQIQDVSSGSNVFQVVQDSGVKFGIDGVTGNANVVGHLNVGNNAPIWSGSYGGAVFLKGNNSTSDRYARICIVDSTGSAINDGLTVNNSGSVTINSDQTYGLEVSGTGSGLRFTQGSNQRIYFNTNRALEGNSDGSILQIGEGYTQALVQAREKYSVDGAIYGRVIIRFNATTTGDRLTAVTANLNTLLGLSTSDYGQWTVEFGGYAGSGTNGCTGSFTIGGYTGHNYSATNHNSYGAGTINVGYSSSGGASTGAGPLSYHPVQNNGMYIASGEVWVYVPAAQQVGIMIKNSGSQNLAGTMTVTATVRS